MTNEELLSVAEIVERLSARFHKQLADHEAKMAEHRAAFGARTKADAETIDRLHTERDALRAEVAELKTQLERLTSWAAKNQAARETLQTEIERLKSQTPKHPVKVGEWVRRTTAGSVAPIGKVGLVLVVWSDAYEVQLRKGFSTLWSFDDCTPCDPPTESTHDTPEGRSVVESVIRNDRNTEPRPGDTVRLVRIPSRSDVSPKLQTTLEWPWIERWGTLNQTALVVEPAYQLAGAVSVCLSANVHARWPICCVEVVRTEPDDIKVGDLVEVFQSSSTWTFTDDVGKSGTITRIETDPVSRTEIVHLREHPDDDFALCDVRKVTT